MKDLLERLLEEAMAAGTGNFNVLYYESLYKQMLEEIKKCKVEIEKRG
jgi:hypothetical protein